MMRKWKEGGYFDSEKGTLSFRPDREKGKTEDKGNCLSSTRTS